MTENRKMLVWLGFFTLLTMAFITYLALKIGGVSFGDQPRYRLLFTNATGIPDNADVRISGIKVGQVDGMALAPEGGAEVWIRVEPQIVVHGDARAVVKSKSLLGERFIELQTGSGAERLESGTTITNTVTPLRIEDLGEILGPLVQGIDPEQVQMAFQSIVGVIVENREAIAKGAKAFGEALKRVSDVLNDPKKMAEIEQFMKSLTSLTIRLDKLVAANDENLSKALAEAGLAMSDIRELASNLKKLSADFPETAADASELLKRANKMLRDAEQIDGDKIAYILKTVLQREGLTFSVRGYTDAEIREQLESYDNLDFKKSGAKPVSAPTH